MNKLTFVLTVAVATLTSAATPITIAIPNRVNSTPWVAASGAFVAVAWTAAPTGEKSGDVYAAISRDGGATFDRPVRVNSVAGDARVSGEIAPRIAVLARSGSDPLITVTWNAKEGTTQIRTARSHDGGKTFGEEMNLQ